MIQSITDIETLEAAKLATRQQIHHELCANKKVYNFKLLAGVKGTFKFADAWKYLTQPRPQHDNKEDSFVSVCRFWWAIRENSGMEGTAKLTNNLEKLVPGPPACMS